MLVDNLNSMVVYTVGSYIRKRNSIISKGSTYNWKSIVCRRQDCIFARDPFKCKFNHTAIDPSFLLECFEKIDENKYWSDLNAVVYDTEVEKEDGIISYLLYKTRPCPNTNNEYDCSEGKNCVYYHSDKDKNINNIITTYLLRSEYYIRSVKWTDNPGIICRNEKVNSNCFGLPNNCVFVGIHTHLPSGIPYILYQCAECGYRDKYVII